MANSVDLTLLIIHIITNEKSRKSVNVKENNQEIDALTSLQLSDMVSKQSVKKKDR